MNSFLGAVGFVMFCAFGLFLTVGLWVIGLGAFFQWVGIL